MGRTEFEKIKKRFKFQTAKTNITEKFRFGPSRVYESTLKVKLPLKNSETYPCLKELLGRPIFSSDFTIKWINVGNTCSIVYTR